MASFKIDLSTATVFVATPPVPKLVNKQTGEIAMDRETGAPLRTVGLLVSDEGQGDLFQVTIPETGIDATLTPGTLVAVTGLRARDWENEFNGQKRHGISFRAVAVTSLMPAATANGKG
ncbi:SCO3933 family regulatory protein [Streptomyces sp. IBSBF 2435]|uniref:SCO3933 family regulatory protein n=1 Tax=Streptomyces sp. IBSBF 2435 TaxID=2903531 RepID=UPI002FDC5E56